METATGKSGKLLPSNAYTKLEPGQEYRPIVPPEDRRAEVTPWSVTLGLVMVAIFSAACVYMGLRTGNVIEAAIPIAIMAIFFGRKEFKPSGKSTILENVMVQSIGQASGVVAAGAVFLIPALYINGLVVQWWHIFLACAIGGFLGVSLIIPLRKYFVKDLHGTLPFPEGTAINEVLVSGESTSKNAGKILLTAFGLGAAYDFLAEAVHAWNPMMTTQTLLGGFGKKMSALRFDISMNGLAMNFGLGYIIGLRYAAVIAAGSVFANLVLLPLVYHFGSPIADFVYAGHHYAIKSMLSDKLFDTFVKPVGIGAIAVSGIIGILRMGKIVAGSISLGFKGLKGGAVETAPRTQTDLTPRSVFLIQLGSTLLMALLFFVVAKSCSNDAGPDTSAKGTCNSSQSVSPDNASHAGSHDATQAAGNSPKLASAGDSSQAKLPYTIPQSIWYAVVGAGVGFVLSFLFTPVAAQAIAIVGTNPVSGMSLITVVLTILALMASGLKGSGGTFIALVVGCAVCTALSTSGALISDFKVGYWIGSTPRNQQMWKFAGIILASLVVAFVIPLMDSTYHFLTPGTMEPNTKVLTAPQANMLAAVSKGLLDEPANQPWLLYGLGGVVAIVLYMAGVPMLAFALGMYIPIFTNIAILAGAFAAYIVGRTGGSEKVRKARQDQGVLIASGLMAGAAIFGIITAILRQPALGAPIRWLSVGEKLSLDKTAAGEVFLKSEAMKWYEGFLGQGLSLLMFVGLAVACFLLARKGARQLLHEEATAEALQQDGSPPATGGATRR
jgi:uncharacterized oligopeptide transporter (OPT) family protein